MQKDENGVGGGLGKCKISEIYKVNNEKYAYDDASGKLECPLDPPPPPQDKFKFSRSAHDYGFLHKVLYHFQSITTQSRFVG